MKKSVRKMSVLLVCVMVVSLFSGCAKFDPSAYVKALLDNAYLNDSTAFVEQKIGTAEEAAALYEEGIDAEMSGLIEGFDISEELQAEFRDFFESVFSQVKYTVGDAEKISNEEYVVTVTYEQLNVFETTMSLYETATTDYIAEITEKATAGEEVPSDEEMYEEVVRLLLDSFEEAMASATYDEAATATVKVELINNVWTANENDLANLEMVFFDLDSMY